MTRTLVHFGNPGARYDEPEPFPTEDPKPTAPVGPDPGDEDKEFADD